MSVVIFVVALIMQIVFLTFVTEKNGLNAYSLANPHKKNKRYAFVSRPLNK
jgi:hypothetical protein